MLGSSRTVVWLWGAAPGLRDAEGAGLAFDDVLEAERVEVGAGREDAIREHAPRFEGSHAAVTVLGVEGQAGVPTIEAVGD